MTETTLDLPAILEQHRLWLRSDGGSRAILTGANLSRANLSGANLSGANLNQANLSRANLSGANLSGANLNQANLSGADLSGANLSLAILSGANLSWADLSGANLSQASLSGAKLSGAYLIDGGQRSDGYRFVGYIRKDVLMIIAGCRYFSIADARDHWTPRRAGRPLCAETMCILDHIEKVAVIRGMLGDRLMDARYGQ